MAEPLFGVHVAPAPTAGLNGQTPADSRVMAVPEVRPMDRQSVSRPAALMLAISTAIASINAIASLVVARTLLPEEYGRVVYFFSLLMIGMLLFGFGLTTLVITLIASRTDLHPCDRDSQVIYSLLALRVASLAPVLAIGLLLSALAHDTLFVQLGIAVFCAILLDFLIGVLLGLQRLRRAALAYLAQPVLYVCLLLLGATRSSASVILAVEVSFAAASGLVALLLISGGVGWPRRAHFSLRSLMGSLSLSGWIYLITLFQTVYGTYALVWLGSVGQYEGVAQFGVPLNLVRMLPLALVPVCSAVFYPRLCQQVARCDLDQARNTVALFLEAVAAPLLALTALFVVYPGSWLDLLFAGKYTGTAPLLVILAPVGLLFGLETVLKFAAVGTGRARIATIFFALRLALFAVAAFLIFQLQLPRADRLLAWTYLVSSAVGLAVLLWTCRDWVGGRQTAARLALFGLACFGLAFALRQLLPEVGGSIAGRFYKLLIGGAGLGIFSLLFLGYMGRLGKNRDRGLGSLARRVLPALLLVTFGALSAGSAHAQTPGADGCDGLVVSGRELVIDCSPGFATDHDLIRLYSEDGFEPDLPWREQLNDSNSVWMYEVGHPARVALIIRFERVDGHLIAELYDDGDGDGAVGYVFRSNMPEITENNGLPTVKVIANDGWWTRGDRVNFNLDILVDGPVRGNWWPGLTHLLDGQTLRTDDRVDFEIHVRDLDGDGRPDYEWRQDRSPLPEDPRLSGQYRTEIVASPRDDELPVSGSLFWPHLSRVLHAYRKGYNQSLPPIQVDWARARLLEVSEFVASRGRPANYFIYSINRVVEGRANDTNFESPFAFYDLANAGDGWPDASIRMLVTRPDEVPGPPGGPPVSLVQMSWDQWHSHSWDYQVSLLGRPPIDESIKFPEFTINAVPPEDLHEWVTGRSWDVAAFVQVERQPYWTTEHVYEWTLEAGDQALVASQYLTGVSDAPPIEAFSEIPVGFRGEYALDLAAKPLLYMSPLDRKLHLRGAQAGVWNVDGYTEVRYQDLDQDGYLDRWAYSQDGTLRRQLIRSAGYLILADENGVRLCRCEVEPSLFETLPPGDHAQWLRLGTLLAQYAGSPLPGDFAAMAAQFRGPGTELAGASLDGFRTMEGGFRFELYLRPDVVVREDANSLGVADLAPGAYLVTYDGRLSVQPLTAPRITMDPAGLAFDNLPVQAAWTTVRATIRNAGLQDAVSLPVRLLAATEDAEPETLTQQEVSVPGTSETVLEAHWWPKVAGGWKVWVQADASRTQSDGLVLDPLASLNVTVLPAAMPHMVQVPGPYDGVRLAWPVFLLLGATLVAALSILWMVLRAGRNVAGPLGTGDEADGANG